MIYLDTSVVLPLFFQDVHTATVTAYLEQYSGTPAVSPWVGVEIESFLNRGRCVAGIPADLAAEARDTYHGYISGGVFTTLSIGTNTFTRAAALLRGDGPLRSADAVHLAVADLASATLVTADRQLAAAASTHAVNVELL